MAIVMDSLTANKVHYSLFSEVEIEPTEER